MKIKKTLRYDCNCCLNNRNYCPIQSVVLQIKADIQEKEVVGGLIFSSQLLCNWIITGWKMDEIMK